MTTDRRIADWSVDRALPEYESEECRCPECGRKIRLKVTRRWPGAGGTTVPYYDYLGHRRSPPCSLYGQQVPCV